LEVSNGFGQNLKVISGFWPEIALVARQSEKKNAKKGTNF
jgi:hypothetical protein